MAQPLLQAFAIVLCLTYVCSLFQLGRRPLSDALRQLQGETPEIADRVMFTGKVPTDVPNYLKAADILPCIYYRKHKDCYTGSDGCRTAVRGGGRKRNKRYPEDGKQGFLVQEMMRMIWQTESCLLKIQVR